MQKMLHKTGFTLLEVLLYVAIFSIVLGLLSGILIITTRVEVRESAATEVTQQASYVVQTIQRLVRESIQIEDASSSLVLRMPTKPTNKDRTTIFLTADNKVQLKEGDSAQPRDLTSDKVKVDSLSFQKFSSQNGKDVVSINITVTFKSDNPQFAISKTLTSAIARANAANFDSDLTQGGSWSVGQFASPWNGGYFSGNVVTGGDFYVKNSNKGLILTDPVGNCWRITIASSSAFTATSTACPTN